MACQSLLRHGCAEEQLVTDFETCPYKITCKEDDAESVAVTEDEDEAGPKPERFEKSNLRVHLDDTFDVCRSPRSQCMSQKAYDECVELRDAGCARINMKTIEDSCPLIFYCAVPTNK